MCLNNTTLFDESANDDADAHARMMQSQKKEVVTFAGGHTYEITKTQDEEKPQSVGADGVYFSFKTTKDK